MLLPKASNEQENIINQLENHNVMVNAVAGSGKTTTILHIAQHFSKQHILLLTYNKKLKLETREKVDKLNLGNIEVHNYHSFCVKYYDNRCFTDTPMKKILKNNTKSKKEFGYDIIILDECQDMTPLFYELMCKIYQENVREEAKICILGDENQSIYDFNKADGRFIIYADKLFNFNNIPWKQCHLSKSFRITYEMAQFVNHCMLDNERILSDKVFEDKPKYIICDCFGGEIGTSNVTFKVVKRYLDAGYSPEDFFILAPSIKSESSPVRQLENTIKKYMQNIQVYVPVSDEEKLDKDILKGKMVFSTFHQVKGLERKVVIVFNFDDSYFKFYKKNKDPNVCPNELYVACTRAMEHLVMLHHYQNNFLPFLVRGKIKECANIFTFSNIELKKDFNKQYLDTSVTDLVKHIPQDILDKCVDYLKITKIKDKDIKIAIAHKTKQSGGHESIGEITGTAIPSYFEYLLKGKMSIYNKLLENVVENKRCMFRGNGTKVIKNKKIEDKKNYSLEKINMKDLKEDELLYIANRWCTYTSGYLFKIQQITDYNWLTQDQLTMCIDRLNKLDINQYAEFEKRMEREGEPELINRRLIGYIDCINGKDIYEFKCCNELDKQHYLQLAVYMYLYEKRCLDYNSLAQLMVGQNNSIDGRNYYLYNILTDEMLKIECPLKDLKEMIQFLIYNKYFNNKGITDEVFVENALEIKDKYICDINIDEQIDDKENSNEVILKDELEESIEIDYAKMKVSELKIELKKRGLKVGGIKGELIKRLKDETVKQPDIKSFF